MIDPTSPTAALDYLRLLPPNQMLYLPGHYTESSTAGDAVRAITGESAHTWARSRHQWWWSAGELLAALEDNNTNHDKTHTTMTHPNIDYVNGQFQIYFHQQGWMNLDDSATLIHWKTPGSVDWSNSARAEMTRRDKAAESPTQADRLPDTIDDSGEARRNAIVTYAQSILAVEDTLEIDDNAKVSEGDENGCFVQAWAWLSFADTEFDKEPEVEIEAGGTDQHPPP